jgi:hypothetical protein
MFVYRRSLVVIENEILGNFLDVCVGVTIIHNLKIELFYSMKQHICPLKFYRFLSIHVFLRFPYWNCATSIPFVFCLEIWGGGKMVAYAALSRYSCERQDD